LVVSFTLGFLISFLLSFLIIKYFKKNQIASDYSDGPQKFHSNPTPRIGGIAIYISFLIMVLYLLSINKINFTYIILASLPIFIIGFIEDITNKVSPKIRLFVAFISGYLIYYFYGIYINHTDIPIIDYLFNIKLFAIIFTMFAIAGIINSINIIDGYNGLAAVVSIIILLSFAYVGIKVQDFFIATLSFGIIGAIFGFFIWNYPFGKIFLGDGGAYFIGFIIGFEAIWLIYKYEQVSPLFPLLVTIYPVFETIFSIYRRKFYKKTKIDRPDSHHLHQLIFKRIVPFILDLEKDEQLKRNSATSPFLWLLCSASTIPAIIFWNNSIMLFIFILIFIFGYIWLYRQIVQFKIMSK